MEFDHVDRWSNSFRSGFRHKCEDLKTSLKENTVKHSHTQKKLDTDDDEWWVYF